MAPPTIHHGAWFQTTAGRPEMYLFEDDGGILPVHMVGVQASDKEAVVQDRIYHMGAEELRRYWMGKVFRGELTATPRAFSSDVSVRNYVAANVQAVGYIDSVLLDCSTTA